MFYLNAVYMKVCHRFIYVISLLIIMCCIGGVYVHWMYIEFIRSSVLFLVVIMTLEFEAVYSSCDCDLHLGVGCW